MSKVARVELFSGALRKFSNPIQDRMFMHHGSPIASRKTQRLGQLFFDGAVAN